MSATGAPEAQPWARWAIVAGWVAVTLLCAVYVYLRIYSAPPDDDESYILVSLRSFVDGGDLYEQVYTQYGPFYYLVFGGLFEVTGRIVGMDIGRAIAAALWLASSVLVGLSAYRLTGRWFLGLAAQVVAFNLLYALSNEPMHPVALIALLLGLLAVTLTFVVPRRPTAGLAIAGAIGAALALTKVNVGGFALIALAFACAAAFPGFRPRVLRVALIALPVLVPVLLMSSDLDRTWALTYALMATIAILCVGAVTVGRPPPAGTDDDPGRGWLLAVAGGALAATAVIVLAIVAAGTSPGELVRGVLIEPLGQGDAYTTALPIFDQAIPLMFLALAAAFAVRSLWGRVVVGPLTSGVLRLAAGGAIWLGLARFGPEPGAGVGPEVGSSLTIPALLAWVAAVAPAGSTPTPAARFLRVAIPALAVLQLLHAYPVAGSQEALSGLLLTLAGAVCLADGLTELARWAAERPTERRPVLGAVAAGVAIVAVGSLTWLGVIRPMEGHARAFSDGERLPFATADNIRRPRTQVAVYREIAETLGANCPTYVSMPGINAYYLWTGIKPPTGLNTGTWMELLDAGQQQRIVDAIDGKPACVLYNAKRVDDWLQGRPLKQRPLVRYIRANFIPSLTFDDGTELWIRRPPPRPKRER